MTDSSRALAAPGRGRPRKFNRPSKAITLTLPVDTLARLSSVDADPGRAIVKLVERRTQARVKAVKPAEIASYGKHAVIVVAPVKALKRLPGVQLVPLWDGRCLIALDRPHSIPQLELDILDVLARGDASGAERSALEEIAKILRDARASRTISTEERTIIVLSRHREPAAARQQHRRP